MREIIEWLQTVEKSAERLYRQAADIFQDDSSLSAFLREAARDEVGHFQVMEAAKRVLDVSAGPADTAIALDEETRQKVETPFREALERVDRGELTREAMLECIVEAEFSEWNHVFSFVLDSLKEGNRELQEATSGMGSHVRWVADTLDTFPDGRPFADKMRTMTGGWKNRILIVDDSEPIVRLLTALFANSATETAASGGEALTKFRTGYFDVIVSDIDMPGMSGIEFFERARDVDPKVADRFIVFSALIADHMDVITANGLRYLTKPAGIGEIKRAVDEVLSRKVAPR